jgi:prepilin signal peptidase PulO-like enzyme (type II secretory pathway)
MGFGDVKYGAVCGLAVGLYGVVPMLVCAFVLGGATAVVILATRLKRRTDVVAFTPFLFAGVLFALVWVRPYLVT